MSIPRKRETDKEVHQVLSNILLLVEKHEDGRPDRLRLNGRTNKIKRIEQEFKQNLIATKDTVKAMDTEHMTRSDYEKATKKCMHMTEDTIMNCQEMITIANQRQHEAQLLLAEMRRNLKE